LLVGRKPCPGLPEPAGGAQHHDMKIVIRLGREFRRIRPTVLVCALGFLAGGMSGCRQKDVPDEDATSIPETTPAPTAPKASAEGWLEMESLSPGKWVAIEGAADLEWDDESRVLRIGVGTDLNGVRWTGSVPSVPYAVELEARRMSGSDFFCGLTFPVRTGKDCVSLIVGGWGGNVVGISSINGLDASENSTGSQHEFENQRWYRIRMEVGEERLQAWIDDRQVVDAHTEDQKLTLREGPIEACAPFGLATWATSAEVRGVRWRKSGD
jgi:hypothetical protein